MRTVDDLEDAIADEALQVNAKRQPKVELGKLADLLERSGISLADVAKVNRVNAWQGFMKGEDGKPEMVDLVGIQLTPNWAEGPKWPVVQQAAPTVVRPLKPGKPDSTGWETAVILPDTQFGFRMLKDGALDPFHDELALAAALAVVRKTKPELIILLGDFLDLAAHSKYVQEPSFAFTTQQAVNRAHLFLAELRAIVPNARIVVLEGNHDLRLQKSIMVNAAASFGLQRANLPESWPVLTVPHLCRFDDLNVEYASGYPATKVWVNDNLVCIHGSKVRSGKSTAAAVIDDERVSTIFGHVHRIELQHKTRNVRGGGKQSLAATPGCLCRIDGAVPSLKGGIDLLGRPLRSYEDWQHGVAVVTYMPGDGPFSLELVPIHEGRVIFRSKGFLYEP